MTYDQIEKRTSRMLADLDARFVSSNSMTAVEYDRLHASIVDWANAEFSRARPTPRGFHS